MYRRDPSIEELLSAYLDGELSDESQRQVERLLAESAEHRQFLAELRGLCDRLDELPRYQVGPDLCTRILQETARAAARPECVPPQEQISEEVVSAYLDDELPPQQRAAVEQTLAASQEHRQLLAELRSLHESFRLLPRYELDAGFADRVLRRAGQLASAERDASERQAAEVSLRPAAAPDAFRRRWRVVFWGVIATAAGLMLMWHLPLGLERGGGDVALRGGSENVPPAVAPSDLVARPAKPPASLPAEVAPVGPLPAPVLERPPRSRVRPTVPDEALALVSLVQQQSLKRLVLVYELQVTPEGVEKAAFANLLRRHNIRLQDTVPIGTREQESLLKHRFLKDVQAAKADRADMDEVQLFLVKCTGLQADAMYFDLVGRPLGIAAFGLNLTAKETADGVLGRLCEDHLAPAEAAEAVQLLVNFAVLSRTARTVGAFGAIRWVDPALLEPVPAKQTPEGVRPPPPPAAPGLDRATAAGKFRCELLFVVRNLKPLDGK